MKLIETSVKRPVGVIMIVLAVIALGIVSLRNLAVDLYPKIDLPIAVVATSYSGAAPEEVEKLISRPFESAVSAIQGLSTVSSTSQPGSSLVLMRFKSGTDMDMALLEVREKVDEVKGMLPEGANDPRVMRFDPQQIPVVFLGLQGAELTALQEIAENQVQPFLERAEGVASVAIEGGQTREIQIELASAKLRQYGITPGQIVQALASENQSASAGTLKKGNTDLQIRVEGEFTSLTEIENTLVRLPTGDTIKIKDVAAVKDSFKEMSTITKVNDNPALVLSALKQSDANTVDVADNIYKEAEKISKKLPEGVELSIVYDTSVFIRDSINSVITNILIGGVFSILVLWLFLKSMRATFVISLSIPISVITAFTLMYFTGQTVNIISMGGLALGIGMMVDNSIVILENIYSYRQRGLSVKDAAKKGAAELASAVIASTTTTLVVFLPIVFVQGLASDLFTPLALAVTYSLGGSLVVALTLIPMLASKLLSKEMPIEEEEKKLRFQRGFTYLNTTYQKMLRWAIGHRKTTALLTVGAIIVSLFLTPFIGAEFIPSADQGEIEINVTTPTGYSLQETEEITNEINEKLAEFNTLIKVNYLSVGSGGDGGLSTSSNKAMYQMVLVDSTEREMTTKEVLKAFDEKLQDIPGAEIMVSEITGGVGSGNPIQIRLYGSDSEVLQDLAEQVVWTLSDISGVHNPESSMSNTSSEIRVKVDRQIASQYGLSYQEIMSQIQLSFNGQVATRYREAGNEFDVTIILPKEQRTHISDLETMFVQLSNGTNIPLSAVAKLEQVQSPIVITRENQQRQVTVSSAILDRDLRSVTVDIQSALDRMYFPDGYGYEMGGQAEDMAESFLDLAVAFVFSIFLVYTVMAVQFESFLYPFVIMFSVPTMIVGVILGLFVTLTPISVPAIIGLIMLAGIVVNNAIVLVDYINILRRRGYDRTEAITVAGPTRLRPILMTTLTTILGMMPIALGIGKGAEAQSPMAVTIIFGLTTSTIFTLIFVPVMYTYMDDLSKWLQSKQKFRSFIRKFSLRKKIQEIELDGQ